MLENRHFSTGSRAPNASGIFNVSSRRVTEDNPEERLSLTDPDRPESCTAAAPKFDLEVSFFRELRT